MGIAWHRPPYFERLHDIQVTEEHAISAEGQTMIHRTFSTPVGSLYGARTCGPRTASGSPTGAGPASCRG